MISVFKKIRGVFAGWSKSSICGLVLLLCFLLIALLAPVLSPYSPTERCGRPYEAPSADHLLGTNDIGQDILSEMIYGTRVSLFIGLTAALLAVALGTFLGMAAGYLRGKTETAIVTLSDIVLSIPGLTLIVVLIAYLGSGVGNTILIICITSWAGTSRIIRTRTMQISELPFVQIERTFGVGNLYILFRHILPNLTDVVLIRYAMAVGSAMMTETSLSFLGLSSYGSKSWGNILHYAFFRNGLLRNYWWWYVPPILCISLCVLACTLLSNRSGKRLNVNTAVPVTKRRKRNAGGM